MSQATNILFNFVAEYKGRANLKNAEKDMGTLHQSLNKLGKAFAATFSAEKILEFGKASVEAFAADEKSAKILSTTLGNLGLAFSNVPVENFITKLSELNGIAKTDLRGAFSTLVRSTGDATKAQDLLNLGLDVSAGTGKDLSLVTVALAKAYGGNFAAISKLGAGITKAEIKTGDFVKIQKHLASVFKGDAATAADTFSGKIARLKTGFEEFKISIGSGIVQALESATQTGGSVDTFVSQMHQAGLDIGSMVVGLGDVLGKVSAIVSIGSDSKSNIFRTWVEYIPVVGAYLDGLLSHGQKVQQKLADAAKAAQMKIPQGPFAEGYTTLADHAKYVAAQAKLAADKAKALKAELDAQKKITDQKNKQMALDRAALSLKLAGSVADIQNIEIQAALQRGQTADVVNVLLLQRALLNGNADQASILAQEVLKANGLVMDVNGNISKISNAKDPFSDWPPATKAAMDQLTAIQKALADINSKKITITVDTVYTNSGGGSVTTTIPPLGNAHEGAPIVIPSSGINKGNPNALGSANEGAPISYMPVLSTVNPSITQTNNPLNPNGANEGAPINVLVNLNGQTIGNAITDAQVNQSASGIPNSFARNYAGGW